jgi:hypothetical protein
MTREVKSAPPKREAKPTPAPSPPPADNSQVPVKRKYGKGEDGGIRTGHAKGSEGDGSVKRRELSRRTKPTRRAK